MGSELNRTIRTIISIPRYTEQYSFTKFLNLPADIINTIVYFMDLGTLLSYSLCRKNWKSFIKTNLTLPYGDVLYYIPYTTHRFPIKYKLLYHIRKK